MEKIQERALRFVLNDSFSSYSELLRRSSKPSLLLSRLRKLAIEVYKITAQSGRSFLYDLYQQKETPYNLRDNQQLKQPPYHTITYGKHSLRYEGAKLWNTLPHTMKEATTLSQFKRLVYTWLGPSCSCSMCVLCQGRN